MDLSTINGIIVVYHNKPNNYGIMISDFHCSDAKLLDRRTKYKHRRQRPRKNEATSMKN